MISILLIVILVSLLFLVGYKNKEQSQNENWIEFGETDSGIAYYDNNSVNISNNIVICKVKFDAKNKTFTSHVVITYQIDYNNKFINTIKSVNIGNNGKKSILKNNTSCSFAQYTEANKNANIIEVIKHLVIKDENQI